MIKKSEEWLHREIDSLAEEGLISGNARQELKVRYSREKAVSFLELPLGILLLVIGFTLATIGAVWGVAHVWYAVSMTARLVFGAVLLFLSQLGIFAGIVQRKQAQLFGEIACIVHYLIIFVVFAVVEQTFYVGGDRSSYIAVGALLGLPAVYLLRSLGGAVWYVASLLFWAGTGGMLNAPFGVGSIWLMLIALLPAYGVFFRHGDEVRLSLFSWLMTIGVFVAFAVVIVESDYIPFFVLGNLAVLMMLTGYSIDIHKAYGTPFRWFGRIAAIGALIISTVPSVWVGIADIAGFHWSTTLITIVIFAVEAALFTKGVKKRLWAPLLYTGIPVLLGVETLLVRSGIYSSLPLVLSFLYALFIAFYEVGQGTRPGHANHLRLGIGALVILVIAVVAGNTFSPFVPVTVIVIAALVITQIDKIQKKRRARTVTPHSGRTVTDVRSGGKRKNRGKAGRQVEPASLQSREADMPEWMRQSETATTVVAKETEPSQFVPPVFHSPDSVPIIAQQKVTRPKEKATERKPGTSPWESVGKDSKKEKKEPMRSPWADEGGGK